MNMRIKVEICTPEEDEEWALKDRQLNAPKVEVVDKEWSGPEDGLPPAGITVEVRRNDNDWREVQVVAHDDGGIIYRDPATQDHRYKWAIGGGIRPARTPEQRAEDESIHAMRSQDCEPFEGMLSRHDFCRAIYAAIRDGKIPGVEIKRGDV